MIALMDKLTVASLNARGLKNKIKRTALFSYFKEQRYDLVCLQETHITEKDSSTWEKQWGGKILFNVGSNRSRGEVVLVSKHFSGEVQIAMQSDRILVVSVLYGEHELTIANVYAPNDSREKLSFYKKLRELLTDVSEQSFMLCGDFNCVVNNDLDIVSGLPHRVSEVKELNSLISDLGLKDGWRSSHPSEKDFTWSRLNPFIARRLDYCLVSETALTSCVSCEHVMIPSSDHKAVVIELNDRPFQRGPGYWKFNNSLLKNRIFVNMMNGILDTMTNDCNNVCTYTDRWELCKVEIRNFCSEFGKRLSTQNKNDLVQSKIDVAEAERRLLMNPEDHTAQENLMKAKQKMEILQIDKTRGAQVRARIKWIEEGERNTKYFCNLEKNRGTKKVMTRLRTTTGEVTTNQSEILQEQVTYYKNLYNQSPTVEDTEDATRRFMQNVNMPTLTENEAEYCEGHVTLEETSAALRQMKNGSAPGYDGITTEFMKVFWSKIGFLVTNSFNEAFDRGELSYTQKQGVITLLHKANELDREELNNWRPITLTNTDYKILAKVLSERLSSVILNLVNEDQVGYIKGRNAATVIRTIDDVINYLNQTKKAGFILAVDFRKAFDSISKKFLLHVFKVFKFGPDFQKWVSVLTKGTVSSINHGGWVSEPFEVLCGIRQGCPFSPLAFVLAVELLAIKIRNSAISGIETPNLNHRVDTHIKIKQLADDTTLFLKDKQDMINSYTMLKDFEGFTGLKVNVHKTKAIQIGARREYENLPFNTVDKIKILGIYFENGKMAMEIETNWKSKVEHIQALIRKWSKRDLSIQGKVVVVKTFLVSQLVYIMRSIGLPRLALQQINRMLYKFIWQKKFSNRRAFEKVKRSVLEAEYSKGGLNMININDFQDYFYLQWAGKLFEADAENWSIIPQWHLSKIAKDKEWTYINCKSRDMTYFELIQNKFWQEVLATYLDNKNNIELQQINQTNFKTQHLFNNDLIRYKGKILFFLKWRNKGIEMIKDVIHPKDKRLLSLAEIITVIGQNSAELIFEYNAMINAIPKQWFEWLGEKDHCPYVRPICEAKLYNVKPKQVKKILLTKRQNTIPTACRFWENKLGFDLKEEIWQTAWKTTKETRLLVLQWKILHNIYPTNIMLSKMKVRENDKCTYCPETIDYIEHFFCECPVVINFWKSVEQKLFNETGLRVELSVYTLLFGLQNSTLDRMKVLYINHVILVAKMCISIYKKTEKIHNLYVLFEKEINLRNVAIR